VFRLRGVPVILIIVGILVLALCTSPFWNRTTVPEIDTVLRKHIRNGTTTERVIAVLDSLHVEHGDFRPDERAVYAVWRRTYVSVVTEGAIEGRFFFDDRRRLVRYELEESVIGL
jgi:hypothetical protein